MTPEEIMALPTGSDGWRALSREMRVWASDCKIARAHGQPYPPVPGEQAPVDVLLDALSGARTLSDDGAPPPPPPPPSPGGTNDKKIRGAPRKSKRARQAPPPRVGPPSGDELPITVLGWNNGSAYFIDASQQLCVIRGDNLQQRQIIALFGGRLDLLAELWPKMTRGQIQPLEFNAQLASGDLIQIAQSRGLFNELTPRRGIGTWATAVGDIRQHCGDVIVAPMVGGGWQEIRPGVIDGDGLWLAMARIARPAERGLTPAEVQELVDGLRLWQFREAAGDQLALGWLALALYGAAPSWRQGCIVSGEAGSGKSTLVTVLAGLLGPLAEKPNDTSAAGIIGALQSQAKAILLDETESDETNGRADAVVKMLRKMNSGAGLEQLRGTETGGVRRASVIAPALLSAINPVALTPQDRTRFVALHLLARHDLEATMAVQTLVERAPTLSPFLRRHMLDRWPLFRRNFAVLRAHIISVLRLDARAADGLGSVLAAYYALTDTHPLTPTVQPVGADAAGVLRPHAELLERMRSAGEVENNATSCLHHLLASVVPRYEGGNQMTVGRLIQLAIQETDVSLYDLCGFGRQDAQAVIDEYRRRSKAFAALEMIGVRIDHAWHLQTLVGREADADVGVGGSELTWVCIATHHRALRELYKGTVWAGRDDTQGGWAAPLSGVRCASKPALEPTSKLSWRSARMAFVNVRSAYIALPGALFMGWD